MYGIGRRGIAVVVPAVVALLLIAPRPVRAEPSQDRTGAIENAVRTPAAPTLFGLESQAAAADVEGIDLSAETWESISIEKMWATDYHPETDRWTERNNRIKISLFGSGLFFSNNLRIAHDAGVGLRVAWEVPGFIGIRLDSVVVPFSRIETRTINSSSGDGRRFTTGFVDGTTLSVAIFNPELSYPANLAMWAGLGVDVWFYHYAAIIAGNRYRYVDYNFGGNLFFDLEYKVADNFHVGIELREHILYAPQTERGRGFVKLNGHTGRNLGGNNGTNFTGAPHSRNNARPIDIAAIHEIQLTFSLLF